MALVVAILLHSHFRRFRRDSNPRPRHLASCWENLFFYTQFIILQVKSKNYNLLVEVPFYTEDMVSKYLNYFDSLKC